MTRVTTLVTLCAQLLPFVPPVVAVLVWWRLGSRGPRLRLAALAVVSAVLVGLLVVLAGSLHQDPRPFVVDPSHPALFPHPADNGFPSDHTAYAATAALLVATVRRRVGLALLGVSLLAGLARVAANVHHVQDVLASLVIAGAAVAGALLLVRWIERLRAGRAGRAGETAVARPGRPRHAPLS